MSAAGYTCAAIFQAHTPTAELIALTGRCDAQVVLVDVLVSFFACPRYWCRINFIASYFVSGPGSQIKSNAYKDFAAVISAMRSSCFEALMENR
jgi:hypothetical protein